MHRRHVVIRWIWAVAILLGALLVAVIVYRRAKAAKRERDEGRLVIETPSKMTTDAPVELFGAALVEASDQIRGIYRTEEQRRNLGLSDVGRTGVRVVCLFIALGRKIYRSHSSQKPVSG